jgi:hypothetical protein
MKIIDKFVNIIVEKKVGFSMDEVMKGTHTFEPGMGPEGKFYLGFKVNWGTKDLFKWLNPFDKNFLTHQLEGNITVAGLCEEAECSGTLKLAYFTEKSIRYTIYFSANGKDYKYIGEKVNILPWNLPVSHTTCFGVLIEKDSGKLVSRSVVYFNLLSIPSFLWSFKIE